MSEPEPFVCPRCGHAIAYAQVAAMLEGVDATDARIVIENELVWHLECWEAFIDDHA